METEVVRGQREIYGLLAEFADEESLLAAAMRVRSLGFQHVEGYSPYPIHGLAEVLGIRGVRLPRIVLAGGLIGLAAALGMQWYSAVIDYPMNVGGRPLASWPSFMPIAFELTILIAGISAVLGMFALNGLPQPYHPLFNVPEFARASRAGFFLCVEARDPKFDLAETRTMLVELGASGVFEVMPQMSRTKMNKVHWLGLLLCMFLLAACQNGMEDQPKYESFEASGFFDDGTSARPLLANTVARGQLRADTHLYAGQVDGALATEFPFPITSEVLERGQARYNIYCAPCHGYSGYGDGAIVQRGLTPPPSFHTERLRTIPVGHIFDVITNGFGAMYSYGDRIQPQDRWAIIAYIQALQLSQNATLDDVPAEEQSALEAEPENNTEPSEEETE